MNTSVSSVVVINPILEKGDTTSTDQFSIYDQDGFKVLDHTLEK